MFTSRTRRKIHDEGERKSYLVILPRKQRICLIRQDLAQHTRLEAWKLSRLLEDIVRRESDDAPAYIVVVLDCGTVDIL